MKPRSQIIISACAVPSFAFIATNRWASGQMVWALVWALLAVVHGFMLAGALKRAASKDNGKGESA